MRRGGFLDIFEQAVVQPEQNGRIRVVLGVLVDSSESMEGEAGRRYG